MTLQRLPENGVAEHPGVVVETDEVFVAAQEAVLVETGPNRGQNRDVAKNGEIDQGGQHEKKRDQQLALPPGHEALRPIWARLVETALALIAMVNHRSRW